MTDQHIRSACITELDKRKTMAEAGVIRGKKLATHVARTADETANALGINRGFVEKTRVVLDKS